MRGRPYIFCIGFAGGGTGFFLDIVDLLGGEAGAIADLIYILSRGLQVCTLAVSGPECPSGAQGSDTMDGGSQ